MKEYLKPAGLLVLCLVVLAASFLFEGFDKWFANYLLWPLIAGAAGYLFSSAMERYNREMREAIRNEVSKVMSAQFEINQNRPFEIFRGVGETEEKLVRRLGQIEEKLVRRLGEIEDKLDELSGERR